MASLPLSVTIDFIVTEFNLTTGEHVFHASWSFVSQNVISQHCGVHFFFSLPVKLQSRRAVRVRGRVPMALRGLRNFWRLQQ